MDNLESIIEIALGRGFWWSYGGVGDVPNIGNVMYAPWILNLQSPVVWIIRSMILVLPIATLLVFLTSRRRRSSLGSRGNRQLRVLGALSIFALVFLIASAVHLIPAWVVWLQNYQWLLPWREPLSKFGGLYVLLISLAFSGSLSVWAFQMRDRGRKLLVATVVTICAALAFFALGPGTSSFPRQTIGLELATVRAYDNLLSSVYEDLCVFTEDPSVARVQTVGRFLVATHRGAINGIEINGYVLESPCTAEDVPIWITSQGAILKFEELGQA